MKKKKNIGRSYASHENNEYDGALANGAVIVYVWRQRDTEVVAEYLNSADVSGGIVVYHGGMDTKARSKSQNKVCEKNKQICQWNGVNTRNVFLL